MKKSLVALAVLSSFAGAASAANSVTLYGRVDVGYEKFSNDVVSGLSVNGNTGFSQVSKGDVRLGVKGQEDLGNGLAATFQLEGRFDGDTGAKTVNGSGSQLAFFDRESTVGLKGNFGHVRFGRSVAAMDKALDRYVVGERVATIFDPYSSSTRHSNSMFYDYSMGGFDGGFHVSTKGGATGNTNEGVSGQKVGYGAFAGYTTAGFTISAAYQADKATTALTSVRNSGDSILDFSADKEWGVGMAYSFAPVTVSATYTDAKSRTNKSSYKQKLRTITAAVSVDVTAKDKLYAKYMQKRLTDNATGVFANDSVKATYYGIGYSHAFSKRTSVYADVGRYKVSSNYSTVSGKGTGFDFALRHKF
jgi:general bacterial porin, GBP family